MTAEGVSLSTSAEPLVRLRDLHVTFTGGRKPVRAVNGVSLDVRQGEVGRASCRERV